MNASDIDLDDEEAVRLWTAVGELADRLPGEWTLIGGLMVQLHAVEHGVVDVRPTIDIDILGQARPQGTLSAIDATLRGEGFEPVGPDLDGYAHRYEGDGLVVDVLAPDGIKPAPTLGGGQKAVGVPGGSQALSRSETVTVTVAGRAFRLRRPTLLGAVLIKARSLMVHSDPETQREDLLRLLALIDDPRETAAALRKTERAWLRAAERRLNLGGSSRLDAETMRRAGLAYGSWPVVVVVRRRPVGSNVAGARRAAAHSLARTQPGRASGVGVVASAVDASWTLVLSRPVDRKHSRTEWTCKLSIHGCGGGHAGHVHVGDGFFARGASAGAVRLA